MSIYTPPKDNNPSGNSDFSSALDKMLHPQDKPVPGQQEHHKWPRSQTASQLFGSMFEFTESDWVERKPLLVEKWNSDLTFVGYFQNIYSFLLWVTIDYTCYNFGDIGVFFFLGDLLRFYCQAVFMDMFPMV